ncbi:hypothetical protein ROM09_22155, partial [Cronobacter sakazakii]|uniref:hypothetical protein n=1 Tax=Cronobacter sakazakii TaxID=28141 RepID=UPI002893F14A
LMMSLWDALRMNMMISYQELVRTFLSIESRSIKTILSIIYWFVFSWAVYIIGFIVSYLVFGDDEATLIELKPAIAVASLVVASIHTGLFREMLNKE